MSTEKGNQFYIPELDGLRFFAFLLVFIHNCEPILTKSFLYKIAEYGWIGVDLFFCLSAFLITKLLVIEHTKTKRINVKNFYIRRILRIWPLYFIYIFIGLAYTYMAHLTHEKVALTLLGLFTFSYNFTYYFLFPSPILIFIHLWSISYEEQFYICIPWILIKLRSLSISKRSILLLSSLLIGNLIRAVFIYQRIKHPIIYFLPFTHFEAMIFGIIIGLGLLDKTYKKVGQPILLILGGLLLFLLFLIPNNQVIDWHLPFTYTLSGIGTACILLSVLGPSKNLINNFLKSKVFVFLGRISFGLYVFHFLGISLTAKIFNSFFQLNSNEFSTHYFLFLIIGFSITLLFSIISYLYIETPFLELKKRFSLQPV